MLQYVVNVFIDHSKIGVKSEWVKEATFRHFSDAKEYIHNNYAYDRVIITDSRKNNLAVYDHQPEKE